MYKLQPNDWRGNPAQMIFDVTNSCWIPIDPANTDYQQFLKYQSEGGKVYGADEEIPAEEQQ